MKYFILFSLLLLTVLGHAQNNLAENGDFESGVFHANGQPWFLGGGSTSKAVASAEVEHVFNGNYSAKITHSTDGNAYDVNYIYNSKFTDFLPGEKYVLSVYAKALDSNAKTKELKFTIKHDLVSGTGSWVYTQKTIRLTETYTKYELEYTVPEGFNSLQLNLWFGTYAGTYYIDNVVFEKTKDVPVSTVEDQVYVSNTGNDANNGAIETPFKTIDHAVSVMKQGDTLFIRGGIYREEVVSFKSGIEDKPIVIMAYANEEPIIDGSLPLSNWINIGTNLWETSDPGLTSRPTALSINNELQGLGRHPNADAANSGYWTIKSHADLTKITSDSITSVDDWRGADIVIRSANWKLDKATVETHSGNTVTFNDDNVTEIRDQYGFFFQNTPNALDVNGEWCYLESTNKIQLYSTTDPSTLDIAVANIDYSLNLEGKSNIVVEGITFTTSKQSTIYMYNTENCTFRRCVFKNAGQYACIMGKRWNSNFTSNITFENNTFSKIQSTCIEGGGENITITGNTFLDIAFVPGMGKTKNRYIGLMIQAEKLLVEKNRFERIGYIPMHLCSSTNALVNKNYAKVYCTVLDDGAGIYFATGNFNNSPINRRITDNIILNGVGASDGTEKGWPGANGIYYDDNSTHIISEGNTVAYLAGQGFYYHNAYGNTSKNNTVFASRRSINFQIDNINPAITENNTVTNNIFVLADIYPDEYMFRYVNFRNPNGGQAGLQAIGVVDSNYYCAPFAGDQLFTALNKNYNYEGWKNYSGFDNNSVLSPVKYESFDADEHIRFEYNASDNSKTIIADHNYISPDGIIFDKGASIEIRPFGSVVLLKDNQVRVDSLTLNKQSLNFEIGVKESENLQATVYPDTASIQTVIWSSSNPDVATVSDAGLVMAIAEGTAIIKATSADVSGFFEECEVTVVDNKTSVSDINTHAISVYPNPVSTEIYVTGIGPNTIYSIYNLNGQKVLEGEIFDGKTINSENLNTGYYILLTIQDKTINKTAFVKE